MKRRGTKIPFPRTRGSALACGLAITAVAAGTTVLASGCYSTGGGSDPPAKTFYYPVGLAVSRGGGALYAVNSDFDLQWNGGTVQSFDLQRIRRHAARNVYASHHLDTFPNGVDDASTPDPIPYVFPVDGADAAQCPETPPGTKPDGSRYALGQGCAPPVDSTQYFKDGVTIGAFATDLILSKLSLNRGAQRRLFIPVRGDATLTWLDVNDDAAGGDPFPLDCGPRQPGNRCDASHHAGNDASQTSRNITMPGEPFGIAESEDGTSLVITHQLDTKTSLFDSGLTSAAGASATAPRLQFIVDGVPLGGNGIAAVPHTIPNDPSPLTQAGPAFLQTSRAVAEIDLLRYYPDQGVNCTGAADGGQPSVDCSDPHSSSLARPYLTREAAISFNVNASGLDSRGIVIDDSQRRACALAGGSVEACKRIPARLFVANRSPPSILLGQVGGLTSFSTVDFDPDRVSFFGNIPLPLGPSHVYLAPIVDRTGHYALRLFVVCFDSRIIYVYDPDAERVETLIRVGSGPFAMAFDPFDWDAVARRDAAPQDTAAHVRHAYRFAYVGSFTDSYVQVIDLDNSLDPEIADPAQQGATFEKVVFTLGQPTPPKGSK